MTLNNHQEESLKKALKEQDKRIKEAYVNDSWMFDETITTNQQILKSSIKIGINLGRLS